MRAQLEFLLAGSEVTRYHTLRTIQTETVGHHSHGVAVICCLIEENPSAALLKAALVHDLAEHQLGDIPSPAKKKYGIGEQVNELEEQLLRGVGFGITLDKFDKRTLKLADIFQGMLFCLRETELGNKGAEVVFNRYRSYAEDLLPIGAEREVLDTILKMKGS